MSRDPHKEPVYRLFDAAVTAVSRPTPSFVRVTLGGPELAEFAWGGLDQRIKVLVPRGDYPPMAQKDPQWYQRWCELPEETRPIMRTYTVRDRREYGSGVELDIDFAMHGDVAGPATRWAASASPGARLRILGPNSRFAGEHGAIAWIPPEGTTRFVIAGDETALPAIACILASLPAGVQASVFAELPERADLAALGDPAAHPSLPQVRFVPRGAVPGAALADAVCAAFPIPDGALGTEPEEVDVEHGILWEVPGLDPATGERLANDDRHASMYVWLAGEAEAIKRIRRHLVRDVGFDRRAVSFMGYWRDGRAENCPPTSAPPAYLPTGPPTSARPHPPAPHPPENRPDSALRPRTGPIRLFRVELPAVAAQYR